MPGRQFESIDPASGEIVWSGKESTRAEVDAAVAAARRAAETWAVTPVEQRIKLIESFCQQLRSRHAALAETISRETGKPLWESLTEVDSMIGKGPLSIRALRERRSEAEAPMPGGVRAVTRYKPHGVLAVFGPFNFPGHLPNGHIVPALLAGNTVVFKPSEHAPLVAEQTAKCWLAAGLPEGVLNVVQGGRSTGELLAAHAGIDGLLFTGSVAAGQALHRAFAQHPQKILALELGGNAPLVVWDAADLDAAAYVTVQSAYLTAGQRCSCARRLIVQAGPEGDRFVERLAAMTRNIRVGAWTVRPEPFMGPVISVAAADRLLAVRDDLLLRGGVEIVPLARVAPSPATLSSGLIDVTDVAEPDDVEHFGPLLQLIRVKDFDAALREANRTAFGLAAGFVGENRELYERFYRGVRAGLVNWNRPTTGASGALPFGGVGLSGNHRPSGYFAADYCSYPVASLEIESLALPPQLTPGISAEHEM